MTAKGPLITLCYHDVIDGDDTSASGFPGPDAATYKIQEREFRRHAAAISKTLNANADSSGPKPKYRVEVTFDDGGASACRTADILEYYGLRGVFFIPTDYIGRRAFVTPQDIVTLRSRGHSIGSHSCSHRGRMSSMAFAALFREWSDSIARLSDILGEAVAVASVPSGYYARHVGEAAAAAGLTTLFTLEPTLKAEKVASCLVVGRYMMRQRTTAEYVAAICSGALLPRLRQQVLWNAKKALKAVPAYSRVRRFYFANMPSPR
jgi:peptidoglycan/xylan/chitin deacetylase (PgdA/CDA1 family)